MGRMCADVNGVLSAVLCVMAAISIAVCGDVTATDLNQSAQAPPERTDAGKAAMVDSNSSLPEPLPGVHPVRLELEQSQSDDRNTPHASPPASWRSMESTPHHSLSRSNGPPEPVANNRTSELPSPQEPPRTDANRSHSSFPGEWGLLPHVPDVPMPNNASDGNSNLSKMHENLFLRTHTNSNVSDDWHRGFPDGNLGPFVSNVDARDDNTVLSNAPDLDSNSNVYPLPGSAYDYGGTSQGCQGCNCNNNDVYPLMGDAGFPQASTLQWSEANSDWAQFYVKLCGRECRNGSVLTSSSACRAAPCFDCDCAPSCGLRGTCCPSFDNATDKYVLQIRGHHLLHSGSLHSAGKAEGGVGSDGDTTTSMDFDRKSSDIGNKSDGNKRETGAKSTESQLLYYNRIKCHNFSQSSKLIAVVACPDSWTDETIRDQCEHSSLDSKEAITPYTDLSTGLVFVNAYCAVCNGYQTMSVNTSRCGTKECTPDDQPIFAEPQDVLMSLSETHSILLDFETSDTNHRIAEPMTIRVQCQHFQKLYKFTDEFEFFRNALGLGECQVNFDPPNSLKLSDTLIKRCKQSIDESVTPSHCAYPDQRIHQLCVMLPPLISLLYGEHTNVFCLMCNYNVDPECSGGIWPTEGEYGPHGDPLFKLLNLPPIYLLFNPVALETRLEYHSATPSTCLPGQWLDHQMNCSDALCDPGKLLKEGECTTALTSITGLSYNISIILTPSTIVYEDSINYYGDTVEGYIQSRPDIEEHMTATRVLNKWCPINAGKSGPELFGLYIVGEIIASKEIARDDFEQKLLDHFFGIRDFLVYETGVDFNIACLGTETCRHFYDVFVSEHEVKPLGTSSNYGCFVLEECSTHELVMSSSDNIDMGNTPHPANPIDFIDIRPMLACPYVRLIITSKMEFSTDNGDGGITISVMYMGKEISFAYNASQMALSDKHLAVCVDHFNDISPQWRQEERLVLDIRIDGGLVLTVSFYSEIVCMLVSVLCLAATFFTYWTFPSLRSIPGRNNMSLCASLATAQSCLLVTSVFGVRGQLHRLHCLVHGLVLHYSWVAAFFWMNACCIHMFRVFKSSQIASTWNVRKTYFRYCLYGFGAPAAVVIATVAVSLLTSGSPGYSDRLCFLDVIALTPGYLVVVLALLVPFALTMAVNFVLFFLTVKEICAVTKMNPMATANNRSGVLTYVKLSTLTGGFCLVSAAAVYWDSAVLMLLTGPLACLQGAYIFASFMLNKHVYQLYAQRLSGTFGRIGETTGTGSTRGVASSSYSQSAEPKTRLSSVKVSDD